MHKLSLILLTALLFSCISNQEKAQHKEDLYIEFNNKDMLPVKMKIHTAETGNKLTVDMRMSAGGEVESYDLHDSIINKIRRLVREIDFEACWISQTDFESSGINGIIKVDENELLYASMKNSCHYQIVSIYNFLLTQRPKPYYHHDLAEKCENNGGKYFYGTPETQYCIYEYTDGGKACTSSDQCEGFCVTDRISKLGVKGVCQASSDRKLCWTAIEKDRIECKFGDIWIDCSPADSDPVQICADHQ